MSVFGIGLAYGIEERGPALEVRVARGRQADLPRRALEQPDAEPRLQRGELAAHRRLRASELPRRRGEASGSDHRHEGLGIPDTRHARTIHTLSA